MAIRDPIFLEECGSPSSPGSSNSSMSVEVSRLKRLFHISLFRGGFRGRVGKIWFVDCDETVL